MHRVESHPLFVEVAVYAAQLGAGLAIILGLAAFLRYVVKL